MITDQNARPYEWPKKEPEIALTSPAPAADAESPAAAPPEETQAPTPAAPAATTRPLPSGIEEGSTHAYVYRNLDKAVAVVRSMVRGAYDVPAEGPLAGLTNRQEIAALMAGLGWWVGVALMRSLHQDDAAQVGAAVAEEPEVKHGAAMHALDVLRQRMEADDYLESAGQGLAQGLLGSVFGGHRARQMVHGDQAPSGFAVLRDVAPEQVAPFISHEHPQTIALTLSQLEPARAAGILQQLPPRLQADVSYRIATMENVTPAVLLEIEEALEASLRDMLSGNQDVGGPKVVADMINMTGSSTEKNVLDQMDAQDPEVAEAVRNLMFTFADISKLTDRELQVLLQNVDKKDMVIALKAAEEELKDKLLGNMSEEQRTYTCEEMEFLGPMRLSEVEEIQLRIVQQVRQLEEQGQITIVRGDADDAFV